jgi:hypothetical protein
MIHEVDETLRQFVRRDALPGSEVDVAFEAPTKDWASRRTGPVVDLYLYDIREDTRRREYGEIEARGPDGSITARYNPPRWYKLSYLVTAWTQRPEDEHRLLSVLLACFLTRDCLPRDLLVGGLADARAKIPYTCALPPPQDRALSDVWSALGGELKPSLDLVLIAPFDLSRYIEVGPPVDAPLGLDFSDTLDGGMDVRRFPSTEMPDIDPEAVAESAAARAAERAKFEGAGSGGMTLGANPPAKRAAAKPTVTKSAAKHTAAKKSRGITRKRK